MRSVPNQILGALALAVALAGAPVVASAQSGTLPRWVEGQVIVKFGKNVTKATLSRSVAASVPGASIRSTVSTPGGTMALATFPRGAASVEEMVARYSKNPDVIYAEPNYLVYAPTVARSAGPHDAGVLRMKQGLDASGRPTFREVPAPTVQTKATYPVDNPAFDRWGWFYSNAHIVWPLIKPAAMVAVLDTGCDYVHPDLYGKVQKGRDIVNDDGDPMDDNGHGTHVTGIIVAKWNNKIGIAGAGNGLAVAYKVLNYAGIGTHFDIAQGIRAAAGLAAVRVINLSFGGPDPSSTLEEAVDFAVNQRGKLIVTAAGNAEPGLPPSTVPPYPAAYAAFPAYASKVLAVAAQGVTVAPSGGGADVFVEYCQAPYSYYGSWVNIVAPGTDIYSTTPYQRAFFNNVQYGDSIDGYNSYSGTSMAAPFVAAAAARLLGVSPALTSVQVTERLIGPGSPVALAFTGTVDVDQDGTDEIQGCWDPTWADAGADRTLPLVDLDISKVMQRSAVWGYAHDAQNGLALTGASAQGVLNGAITSVSAAIGSSGNPVQNWYDILNLPWNTTPYQLRISKLGYTAAPQVFQTIRLNESSVWFQASTIAVPPQSGNSAFVTTWGRGDSTYVEMDQHVLFPVPPASMCDVGFDSPGLASNSAFWCGLGTLVAAPYTRYLHDSADSGLNLENTTSKYPLYATTLMPYNVFVVDYNSGADLSDYATGWPVTRLWRSGAIKATVPFGHGTQVQGGPNPIDLPGTPCTLNGGTADCFVWKVGTMVSSGAFTAVNQLGDGAEGSVIPFGGSMLKMGTSPSR